MISVFPFLKTTCPNESNRSVFIFPYFSYSHVPINKYTTWYFFINSCILFLSVDVPVDNISVRRKNFYLRNGFYDTNKFYEDTGINYEVLCTNNEYEINDKFMKMRYINMTNNHELFEVISNTFNVGVVNLKNKNKHKK